MNPKTPIHMPASLELLGQTRGVLTVKLQGDWAGKSDTAIRPTDAVLEVIRNAAAPKTQSGEVVRVALDGASLPSWDSRLLVAIASSFELPETLGLEMDLQGLPNGIRGLLRMSREVPPRGERRSAQGTSNLLVLVGRSAMQVNRSLGDANEFFGQSLLSLWRFVRGKAWFLRSDILEFIQVTGPQALPIVGILVAITGCMHCLQSGRSASAVGDAATKAVVSGIVAIIVMTAVFAVITNVLRL